MTYLVVYILYTCFRLENFWNFPVQLVLRQTAKSEQQAIAFLSRGISKWLSTDVVYVDCQTYQVFYA